MSRFVSVKEQLNQFLASLPNRAELEKYGCISVMPNRYSNKVLNNLAGRGVEVHVIGNDEESYIVTINYQKAKEMKIAEERTKAQWELDGLKMD